MLYKIHGKDEAGIFHDHSEEYTDLDEAKKAAKWFLGLTRDGVQMEYVQVLESDGTEAHSWSIIDIIAGKLTGKAYPN